MSWGRRFRAWNRMQAASWFGVWGWAMLATEDSGSTILLDGDTQLIDGTVSTVDGT